MSTPLLTTKLYLPPARPTRVPRPRLTARVSDGLTRPLTLISAPAGFGKTTLISEWRASEAGRNVPLAWLSLDDEDNDPTCFLTYFVAALQTLKRSLGETTLALLHSPQPSPPQAILTSLINDLSEFEDPFALVLDDYHVVTAQPIHEALAFFLDHLPPPMHLVILTRVDPFRLPLARLRARNQLTEIRAADLRFTHDEAATFLNRVMGLALSADDVKALETRTEGWIAGLQLAALSMQGREDVAHFVTTFSGGHHYIVDYLAEEVLNRQPDSVKSFLLQTSILDRLTGPLCDALTQRTDGQTTLEDLEGANLFVIPLDDDRRWYRYHRLFVEVMANRLQRWHPDQLPELHRRAANWCEQNNFIAEAIEHALSAKDYPSAADMAESKAIILLREGDISTLLGWLNKLPEEITKERPRLSVAFGWVALLTGKLENVEGHLSTAEGGLGTVKNIDELRGQIAAIRAYASAMRGDVEQAMGQAHEALELLPKDDLTVRCVVTFVLGGVYYIRQDIPKAIAAMKEASQMGEQTGNIHVAVSALSSAGDLLRSQVKLDEAERVYDKALKLGAGRSGNPLPICASAYSGLAEIHMARGGIKDARQAARKGVELGELWANLDSQVSSYLTLAQVEHLAGNTSEAQSLLEQAKRLAAEHTLSPGVDELFAKCEARLRTKPPASTAQAALLDPLSERELEILRLFGEGLSNDEIAERLIISLGTVKAHSSNIYRKLDVRNRAQAIVRARELKLL